MELNVIKEIREALMTLDRVKFTVEQPRFEGDVFEMVCRENGINSAVRSNFDQMNVSKFGPTCVTLYTFDMLGKKTVGKIKFADVTLVSHTVVRVVDEETGQIEQETIEF